MSHGHASFSRCCGSRSKVVSYLSFFLHTLLMIDQRQRAGLEPDPELQRTLDTMKIGMEKGVLALSVLAP
jgi:hypothetical protein